MQAFILFPFEVCISIAMVLVGLASAFAQAPSSAALSDGLEAKVLIAWQITVSGAGVIILTSLFSRPWASRRVPPVKAEQTIAQLRTVEATGCLLMAFGAGCYALVVGLARNGDFWDGSSFIILAMIAVAVGYVLRAIGLNKANSRVLHFMRQVNDAGERLRDSEAGSY
jgi:hypothetical protein